MDIILSIVSIIFVSYIIYNEQQKKSYHKIFMQEIISSLSELDGIYRKNLDYEVKTLNNSIAETNNGLDSLSKSLYKEKENIIYEVKQLHNHYNREIRADIDKKISNISNLLQKDIMEPFNLVKKLESNIEAINKELSPTLERQANIVSDFYDWQKETKEELEKLIKYYRTSLELKNKQMGA